MMKRIGLLLGAAVAALVGCDELAVPKGLQKAELDRGGTTFDFKACSDRHFDFSMLPKDGTKGSLIPDDDKAAPLPANYQKWHKFICFNHGSLPSDSPFRRDIYNYVHLQRRGGEFAIAKGEDLRTFCAKCEYKDILYGAEGTWRKYVRLPDANGGAYRFSMRYKMRHGLPHSGCWGLVIIHTWKLTPDGKNYKHISRPMPLSLDDGFAEWTPTYFDFDVPSGADIISIQIRHDGVGELLAKDVFLARTPVPKASKGITISLTPAERLDGTFALSAGQCGHLTWAWRQDEAGAFDAADSEMRLTLSSGFEFLGDTFAGEVKTTRTADDSTVVAFTKIKRQYVPTVRMPDYNFPATLIRATGPAGREGTCTMSCWRKGRKIGESRLIRLVTIPTITTESPARYLYAAMPGASQTINFSQPAACTALAHFLGDIGVRQLASEGGGWIDCANTEVYKREFRAAGGRRITPCWGGIANGYYIGNHNDTPEGDRFVSDAPEGGWKQYVENSVCPLVVIEERAYFREKVLPGLAKRMKGCDGLRANWEPFMFVHHGCYCEKCRAKFAKWAKIDESVLKADWPSKVKVGAAYGREWTRFRSLESAELVRVLNRHVMGLTGGENSLGFIPAITWREMDSMWPRLHPSPESEPIDYAADIPTIGTWGPYVMWDASKPYRYCKRSPLVHFIASKDVREQTDRDYPPGKRPQLLGGTQGLQCGYWICQPEWLEMAMDSFFFNGFAGTQAYYFPEGLDARHAAAYARSAARAAKAEHAVWDGKRNDASVTLVPVPEYATPSSFVSGYLPDYRNIPMLQKAAYDVDGGRTVAVFNFWELGEAFFALKASGLRTGDYVVVDEAGILYAPNATKVTWTAAELAGGIRLQVGATRTRVFSIRPASAAVLSDVKSVLTAADLAAAYEAAKPALRKAAEADAEYERLEGGRTVKDTKAEI